MYGYRSFVAETRCNTKDYNCGKGTIGTVDTSWLSHMGGMQGSSRGVPMYCSDVGRGIRPNTARKDGNERVGQEVATGHG